MRFLEIPWDSLSLWICWMSTIKTAPKSIEIHRADHPSGILRIHSNEALEVWSGHIPWFLFVEPHAVSTACRAQNSVKSLFFLSIFLLRDSKYCLGMGHTWKSNLDHLHWIHMNIHDLEPMRPMIYIESTWWLYDSSFCKASNWGNNSMSRRTPFM